MLTRLLRSIIRDGTLTVCRPGVPPVQIGKGEPYVTIQFHDRLAPLRLATNPDLALGELYTDGRLTVEQGDIGDLLNLLLENLSQTGGPNGWHRLSRSFRRLVRAFAQFNPAPRAKAHVAHHYDLSAKLYELFLDKDKQYSCAYFSGGSQTLEDAQVAKKRHILAKLNLDRPDLNILDIGCGWGGLALDLAGEGEANVTGITLSEEQFEAARSRAAKAGLSERCKFALRDYRAIAGTYDRIVSVGMFEHVGARYYEAFFRTVENLPADDGVMLLHTIGRVDGPGSTNPWIAKYIFPGGYVPALSEIMPAIERNGLMVTDVEVLRLHYAETLKSWRKRFDANRAEIAILYDERFCRMWEFYLAGAEAAMRYDGQVVFQIQIAKRIDSLPTTRDYMFDRERNSVDAAEARQPNKAA